LGKEEISPFFKLQVTGDPNTEVAPTIIVKPQDTQIIKDQDVTHINCIANARYSRIFLFYHLLHKMIFFLMHRQCFRLTRRDSKFKFYIEVVLSAKIRFDRDLIKAPYLFFGIEVFNIEITSRFRSLHELRTIWMKDGIPIENSRISYSFNDSWNRTLALISANVTYTGIYSCHVDLRSGGYPTVNASAKIIVYGKRY